MNRTPLFIVLFLTLLCYVEPSRAEEDSPAQSAGELMTVPAPRPVPRPWELNIDTGWWPKSDSRDAGGQVGLGEFRVKLGRSIKIERRFRFTPELSYTQVEVSAPAAARLPGSLYSTTLGLRLDHQLDQSLGYSAFIAPSIAGDYRAIGSDDVRVRLGVIGRFVSSQRLTLLAGLLYTPGYHVLPVLPIIGLVYRPDERWTISIAAPRPSVSYAVTPELKLNLNGEYNGTEYQLHQDSLGARVVRYRDFRFTGGAEWNLADRLTGEVAAGYAFYRKFLFYEQIGAGHPDLSIDNGPFARASLNLRW
ncbi:hypothetical protein GMLC_27120 [Geomonas limicola]|uniref:DUF6268 domain-containing protein n=1 Tax=Geomonas limicola TaxID=2740186 RepID=A0A6V8NC63_9BACT|nr:DUF6268 family outer membrane beta-barrel protein [Geomonas limicola]GFO69133.1 hypothetical protein GMLC_27120 [Geomonas limicola]